MRIAKWCAVAIGVAGNAMFLSGCAQRGPIVDVRVPSVAAQKPIAPTPPAPGSPAAPGGDRGLIRAMSFNLRVPFLPDGPNYWDHRKELLARTIRDFLPDVLGTQECLLHQAAYLQQELPEYDYVGYGRNDGAAEGEMCALFYRVDRFVKLDEGHFWLSKNPDEPGSKSWGSAYPRMATWVKLRSRDSGRAFYAFDTHLDNRGSHARVEQAHLLRERMERITRGEPVVLTGDFNSGEGSTPYLTLLTGPGPRLIDTYRQTHRVPAGNDGTFHGFSGGTDGERIDWIVTNESFKTLAANIFRAEAAGRFPSDHFPVTAVLQLQPNRTLRTASAEPRPDQAADSLPGFAVTGRASLPRPMVR